MLLGRFSSRSGEHATFPLLITRGAKKREREREWVFFLIYLFNKPEHRREEKNNKREQTKEKQGEKTWGKKHHDNKNNQILVLLVHAHIPAHIKVLRNRFNKRSLYFIVICVHQLHLQALHS